MTCIRPLACYKRDAVSMTVDMAEAAEMVQRPAAIANLWLTMADIIGDHTFWPPYIRAIFWTKDIGYHNRFKIVVFAAVNGLPGDILKEWLSTYQCVFQDDLKSWDHINWLISECYYGTYYKHIWFTYNVHNRYLQYIDGNRVGEDSD